MRKLAETLGRIPDGVAVRLPYSKVSETARPSHRVEDFQLFFSLLYEMGLIRVPHYEDGKFVGYKIWRR